MKTRILTSYRFFAGSCLAVAILLAALSVGSDARPRITVSPASLSADGLSTAASNPSEGDGLYVSAAEGGARLRCDTQRLAGHVTNEGLWLSCTDRNAPAERFRIRSVTVGRQAPGMDQHAMRLARTGSVTVGESLSRFIRSGLTEEYSVSPQGVRQDFIVDLRPAGGGALRVGLDLSGAKAEPSARGVRLVLDRSGRKLNYDRLRVIDAVGRELTARLDVEGAGILAAVVDDAAAVYPVRIDPTFSDADWSAMGGVDGWVNAVVTDAAGNLYVGGEFTKVGDIPANGIARWDGNAWSALGSGLDHTVWSIAVSGTDVYVGGEFSTAGGVAANRIAKWDGSGWSALGTGLGVPPGPNVWDYVPALAVIGTDVYAAGEFDIAGGIAVNNIAKWDGQAWSTLGEGLSGGLSLSIDHVRALAAVGTDLYAGGEFTEAGGNPASYIARWNGTGWSTVGSGMDDYVHALVVIGTDLYAGGEFRTAGETPANCIAKWAGSAWSALGSGVDDQVSALTASGTDLYAGGRFDRAGGLSAYYVAKWSGSVWSALGSGMDDYVTALAVAGTSLYVGGDFETAGDKDSPYLARANICPGSERSPAPGRLADLIYSPATGFRCTFLDATPGRSYRIQSSPSLTSGSWTDFMNVIYAGPVVVTDATAAGIPSRFYRAVTP